MAVTEKRDVSKSWAMWERGQRVIPMATQTHSKAPREAFRDLEPAFIDRGKGCRLWDLDGNEYLDFRCSLGPITLGYSYEPVVAAAQAQLAKGTVFSYPSALEVEVAEELVEAVPCAESCRFLKTGGEAMSAAMKLARAFTGRDKIIKCGYHGWLTTMAGPGVGAGTRADHIELGWGNVPAFEEALAAHPGEVAAITVAYSYAAGDSAGTFLAELRRLADQNGCLLIFDEIVTGFRLARGGAQQRFDVTPDLAVFAKGMANGFPISTYLGRRDVMETVRQAVISSTYGGEAVSLAAAKACLEIYRTEDVVGHLEARGTQLRDGLNAALARHGAPAQVVGVPPCPLLQWRHASDVDTSQLPPSATAGALSQRFERELLARGVVIYAVVYVNYSHQAADIDRLLTAADESLAVMAAEGLFEV